MCSFKLRGLSLGLFSFHSHGVRIVSLAFQPPQPTRAADSRLEALAAAVLIGAHASALALV
jgi:hypothetical protein